jgi:uncharacterized membrane protein (UPF0127 family)
MKLFHTTVNGVKVWFIFVAIIACLIVIAFLLETPRLVTRLPIGGYQGTEDLTQGKVRIDGVMFTVDVADTDTERKQGLSGRRFLGEREGMLFIFDKNDQHGIWMKDMNFPIDVLWISENFRIIDIERNLEPSSYPEVERSSRPARYVLELPAGSIDIFSLNGLSTVEIDLITK